MTELQDKIVAAARSWVGTPYHHMARVKGVGADCGQIIIAAYVEAGAIEAEDPGYYTGDWHLHRSEERYLQTVERHLDRLSWDLDEKTLMERYDRNGLFECEPVDVIVFRVGRTFSHGGIVTQWPNMVHAYMSAGIVEEVALDNTPMAFRPMRVYRLRGEYR